MSTSYPPVQGQYLAFICNYMKENGRSPSGVDLKKYFQVTESTAYRMIMKLVKHGWISREHGGTRTIRVLVPDVEVPILIPRYVTDTKLRSSIHE